MKYSTNPSTAGETTQDTPRHTHTAFPMLDSTEFNQYYFYFPMWLEAELIY